MPSALPPPVVVTTGDHLRRLIGDLKRHPRLAIDTESNSLHAYRERVCLIQVSSPDSDYLLDPLALPDLAPLGPLLADRSVEKVFHAAEYDLVCLQRDFGFRVSPLYDTRVAARTLGQERTGLGDMLEDAFGVRLNKRHQRANWGRRPLPPELLDYARLDTHYLLALRDRLAAELDAAGRTAEAVEEFERLSQVAAAPAPADNEAGFWRIANARRLSGTQAAVLQELFLVREAEAERRDVPPFKVVSDAALMAIAKAAPRNRRALEALDDLPARPRARYGEAFLAAVRRGLQADPPPRPAARNGDEVVQLRFQRLREWRRKAAAARRVESDVILPRDVTWAIARANPAEPEALRRLMAPLETRFREHGGDILAALHAPRPAAGRGK